MPLFVTVTPGTTITNSTTLDATVLNLLGTPAIDVTGTVDGGSLSLSAGSVGTNELSDNAVTNTKLADMTGPSVKGRQTGTGDPENVTIDNSTVEIATVSSSPTLRVKDAGISYAKIQNTVNGSRLIGRAAAAGGTVGEIEVGSGLSLSVGGVLSASNTITTYSSPSGVAIPVAGGQIAGFNHTLGGYPSQFRVFAQCVNASSTSGYPLGYRIPIEAFQGDLDVPAFVAWASSSQLGLRRTNQTNLHLNNYNTGARSIYPAADWQLYFEAVRFS